MVPLMVREEIYTLVDQFGNPVYTNDGMDGHFSLCDTPGDVMIFSRKMGWSQMMEMARWSKTHCDPPRIQVFPAKVSVTTEIIPTE